MVAIWLKISGKRNENTEPEACLTAKVRTSISGEGREKNLSSPG